MFKEDNSGFVYFPIEGNRIRVNFNQNTLIYLVAFEPKKSTEISNVNIILPGDFVSDDVVDRNILNDVVKNQKIQNNYDHQYFPNIGESLFSIPLISSICIGWSDNSYELDGYPWKATYRDLTEEGKRLYYSIKKLHNNKEVRILTFNNI